MHKVNFRNDFSSFQSTLGTGLSTVRTHCVIIDTKVSSEMLWHTASTRFNTAFCLLWHSLSKDVEILRWLLLFVQAPGLSSLSPFYFSVDTQDLLQRRFCKLYYSFRGFTCWRSYDKRSLVMKAGVRETDKFALLTSKETHASTAIGSAEALKDLAVDAKKLAIFVECTLEHYTIGIHKTDLNS